MEKIKKTRIKRINVVENSDVYDIKVSDNHNFFANGLLVHNCGEIFMKEDSCRLIHVNFSSFIKDEYEKNASIDSEKLYQVVYEPIRLGDDLVDLEADAITRILKKIENDGDKEKGEYKMYSRLLDNTLQGRRCGVGFFGLADALAKLGIKFDSDEGLSKIGELMDIFYKAQLDSEIDMAVTRGAFPAYSNELEKNATSEWYTYLAEHYPEQYERMMKYGRRNVSFGTCAPTGSVAMLARCSSGIEPIFMPFYTRRVKCTNDSDRVDFVDRDGEKFTEYVTAHPTLQKWAEKKIGDTSSWSPKEWQDAYEKSPWFGSTANDIDWRKRVEIQSIVQKRISHSISSTINLPNNTTEEEVSTIYLESWKRGLKGVTVYRDGCRSGVIVAVDKKEEPKKDAPMICMEDGTAKRRPKTLEAKIIRFNNKGDKWVGIIGMLDGKPYELFTGMLEKLNIPAWVEGGAIVKNYEEINVDGEIKKKSRYDFCYEDKDGYRVCIEGISRIFNPEFWNYGKLISGLLRHHMPIPYIVKVISTLKMDDSTINTWKNGVVRVLRKFESSVADEIEGEKCPECGGRLVRENGCIHCIDCGYSKCG